MTNLPVVSTGMLKQQAEAECDGRGERMYEYLHLGANNGHLFLLVPIALTAVPVIGACLGKTHSVSSFLSVTSWILGQTYNRLRLPSNSNNLQNTLHPCPGPDRSGVSRMEQGNPTRPVACSA